MMDLHRYVNLLDRLEVTPKQFLFLYILALSEFEERQGITLYPQAVGYGNKGKQRVKSSLYHYASFAKKMDEHHTEMGRKIAVYSWTKNDLEYLLERGYIHLGVTGKLDVEEMEVDERILDILITSEDDFEIFWKMYPNHTIIEGKKAPLKMIDKEEVKNLFYQLAPEKTTAKQVISTLRAYISKKAVNYRIDKFLAARPWEDFDPDVIQEEYKPILVIN